MDLARLREAFPDEQIKQREGAGRKMLDYVQSADIIERVIDCTDNAYDWTVTTLDFVTVGNAAYWLCRGVLSIPGLGTRSGVGTAIGLNEDSPKSAETDAYKRAAVKFGVALNLYFKEKQPQRSSHAFRPGQQPAQPRQAQEETPKNLCPECHGPDGKHTPKCSKAATAPAQQQMTMPPAPAAQPNATERNWPQEFAERLARREPPYTGSPSELCALLCGKEKKAVVRSDYQKAMAASLAELNSAIDFLAKPREATAA